MRTVLASSGCAANGNTFIAGGIAGVFFGD
jgi:hypothetical protein